MASTFLEALINKAFPLEQSGVIGGSSNISSNDNDNCNSSHSSSGNGANQSEGAESSMLESTLAGSVVSASGGGVAAESCEGGKDSKELMQRISLRELAEIVLQAGNDTSTNGSDHRDQVHLILERCHLTRRVLAYLASALLRRTLDDRSCDSIAALLLSHLRWLACSVSLKKNAKGVALGPESWTHLATILEALPTLRSGGSLALVLVVRSVLVVEFGPPESIPVIKNCLRRHYGLPLKPLQARSQSQENGQSSKAVSGASTPVHAKTTAVDAKRYLDSLASRFPGHFFPSVPRSRFCAYHNFMRFNMPKEKPMHRTRVNPESITTPPWLTSSANPDTKIPVGQDNPYLQNQVFALRSVDQEALARYPELQYLPPPLADSARTALGAIVFSLRERMLSEAECPPDPPVPLLAEYHTRLSIFVSSFFPRLKTVFLSAHKYLAKELLGAAPRNIVSHIALAECFDLMFAHAAMLHPIVADFAIQVACEAGIDNALINGIKDVASFSIGQRGPNSVVHHRGGGKGAPARWGNHGQQQSHLQRRAVTSLTSRPSPPPGIMPLDQLEFLMQNSSQQQSGTFQQSLPPPPPPPRPPPQSQMQSQVSPGFLTQSMLIAPPIPPPPLERHLRKKKAIRPVSPAENAATQQASIDAATNRRESISPSRPTALSLTESRTESSANENPNVVETAIMNATGGASLAFGAPRYDLGTILVFLWRLSKTSLDRLKRLDDAGLFALLAKAVLEINSPHPDPHRAGLTSDHALKILRALFPLQSKSMKRSSLHALSAMYLRLPPCLFLDMWSVHDDIGDRIEAEVEAAARKTLAQHFLRVNFGVTSLAPSSKEKTRDRGTGGEHSENVPHDAGALAELLRQQAQDFSDSSDSDASSDNSSLSTPFSSSPSATPSSSPPPLATTSPKSGVDGGTVPVS